MVNRYFQKKKKPLSLRFVKIGTMKVKIYSEAQINCPHINVFYTG